MDTGLRRYDEGESTSLSLRTLCLYCVYRELFLEPEEEL